MTALRNKMEQDTFGTNGRRKLLEEDCMYVISADSTDLCGQYRARTNLRNNSYSVSTLGVAIGIGSHM